MQKVVYFLTLTLILISTDFCQAYIPNSRMILRRVALNQGKGAYVIEQEVQFNTDSEPLVLREKWLVGSGDTMKLLVSDAKTSKEGYHLDVLYKEGKRHFIDSQGQVKSGAASTEFIEPYIHFRSSRALLDALIRNHIVPQAFINETAPPKTGAKWTGEPLVRLARSGGVVTYALGEPTPINATKANPGFWIDQDSFVFRRIRFPSQAEVQADRHISAASGLRLPRERVITWEGNSVSVRLLSAKPLSDEGFAKSMNLQTFATGGAGNKAPLQKLPDLPQVKEFYSRFR